MPTPAVGFVGESERLISMLGLPCTLPSFYGVSRRTALHLFVIASSTQFELELEVVDALLLYRELCL